MASNKILTKETVAVALLLGLTVETDGLNNAQLAALLSDLKAKQKDAETVTQADTAEAAEAAEAAEIKFHVMAGKAITSKRGILADGDEIKAEDLAGGTEALEAFVKSGHVGKA